MDEITMVRAVLGTATEPSPQVRAEARASLERRLSDRDAAARHRGRGSARSGLITMVGAAAAVAAIATVIATTPGQPIGHHTGAGPRAETVSYVLRRAAAARADAYHLIAVVHGPNTGSIADGITYVDAATRQMRWVSYRRTSSGQPLLEYVVSSKTDVAVDYRDHVYFCVAGTAAGCAGTPDTSPTQYAVPGLGQAGKGWQNPVAAYNAALAGNKVTVAGHRNLNGRDTVLLRIHQTGRRTPQPPQVEVWVDARTYLVVQETVWEPAVPDGSTVDPATLARMKLVPRTTRIAWLEPTGANLAMLHLSRPWAGFTPVNDHQWARYLGIYG